MLARRTPLESLGTDDDSCSWCGRAWPCSPRRLAERVAVASTRTWQRPGPPGTTSTACARYRACAPTSVPPSAGTGADRAENSRSTGGRLGLALNGLEQPAVRRSGTNRGLFD